MKPTIYALFLILALLFTSCNLNMTQPATPSVEPIASVTPTIIAIQYQLTYISDQHEGFSGVYAMDVGCLDQDIPCFGEPHLLFELSTSPDISSPIGSFAWSPDGKQVAFQGFDVGFLSIFISDWNGENKINITNSCDWCDFPKWTSDGAQVMFEMKFGPERIVPVVKDVKGETVRELLAKANSRSASQAVLTPDGNKIVFIDAPPEGMGAGYYQIFIADLDGTNLHQLTQNLYHHFSPSISPDGKTVVIDEEYNSLDMYSNLVVLCLDGSCNYPITEKEDGVSTFFPSYAPFGGWISYTNVVASNTDIYLVKEDGSATIKLTQTKSNESFPAWRTITP